MEKKKNHLLILLLLFSIVVNSQEKHWKIFEIRKYKIEFPNDFNFIEEKGIDSYISRIENNELIVKFDYGAFTNNLEGYEDNLEYEVKINTLAGDLRKIAFAKNSTDGFTSIYTWSKKVYALGMYSRNLSSENQLFLLDIFENRISLKTLSITDYINQISFSLNNKKNLIEITGILKTESFTIFNLLGVEVVSGTIKNLGQINIDFLKE